MKANEMNILGWPEYQWLNVVLVQSLLHFRFSLCGVIIVGLQSRSMAHEHLSPHIDCLSS